MQRTKLRKLRTERGMSLSAAERATGVRRQTLAALERGEQRPNDVTIGKLMVGYDVPMQEIIDAFDPGARTPELGEVIYSAGYGEMDEDELRDAVRSAQGRLPEDYGLTISYDGTRRRVEIIVEQRPFITTKYKESVANERGA